jgi:hypothetical protein
MSAMAFFIRLDQKNLGFVYRQALRVKYATA